MAALELADDNTRRIGEHGVGHTHARPPAKWQESKATHTHTHTPTESNPMVASGTSEEEEGRGCQIFPFSFLFFQHRTKPVHHLDASAHTTHAPADSHHHHS
jgi:hypothetical protein